MSDIQMKKVEGEDKGEIILFALSTCQWCRKTKKLLGEIGAGYEYVDLDVLEGEEKEKAREEVMKWNPKCSFPTLVVNGECIIGFDEEKIKGLIG